MPGSGIFELTIEKDNGTFVKLCGTEEVLRGEIDTWQSYEKTSSDGWKEEESRGETYCNPEAYYVRTLEGFLNDAVRTQVTVAYRFTDIQGMSMVEL